MCRALLLNVLLLSIIVYSGCLSENPVISNEPDQTPKLSAIIADPISIMPGDSSIITIQMLNVSPDTLDVTFAATGGSIRDVGAAAIFTAGAAEGVAWITVTVDLGGGNTITGSASIGIAQVQPTLSVAVQVLDALNDDSQCLVFTAVAADTLEIFGGEVQNPDGQVFSIPGIGSVLTPVTFFPGDTFPLQSQGSCYTKSSGEYIFTFDVVGLDDPITATHSQP